MSRKYIGKLVYTINANNNQIDSWRCTDVIKAHNNELMYELKDGPKVAILPKRCIYPTFKKSLEVANKR